LSADASHVVTGIPSASRSQAVREGRGHHARDSRDSVEAGDVPTVPVGGYSEISLSRQRIRGPYTAMSAALEAYDRHLGLMTARRWS
jgi:hypothetical protein